jgi:hypothetical protein
MAAQTALIVNGFYFGVLKGMVQCELFEPISNELGPFFSSNEVVFVAQVPSCLSVVLLVVFDIVGHGISVLRVVEHEYFWMLPIPIVYQLRGLAVWYVHQPAQVLK